MTMPKPRRLPWIFLLCAGLAQAADPAQGPGGRPADTPPDCRGLPEEQRQPCEEMRRAVEQCRYAPDRRKCIRERF